MKLFVEIICFIFINFKLMKKLIPFLVVVMFSTLLVSGQDYYFKHYDADDGLSRNTVFTTLLSEKGFLWIGTKDGLNRFDGHRFKVFQNDSENPNSIGDNFIESLHEYDGKLWIGTNNGLFAYDDSNDSFKLVNTASTSLIRDIEHDDNGNLWYISGYTLFKYELATSKISSYDTKTFFYAEELTRTQDGSIWAAYQNRLFKYVKDSDTFEIIEIEQRSSNPSLKISKLYVLDANTLLLGTENQGVIAFDIPTQKTKTLLNDQLFVRDFLLKGTDDLWIAAESGLYIYNLKNGRVQHLQKDLGNPYSLSNNAIYSLTLDNENGVWVGTYFAGLSYYPQHTIQFKKYFPQPDSNSISGNAVREIRSDKFGNFWVGTEDAGLNRLNRQTGAFESFGPLQGGYGLSHYNIHALLPRGDELWIGTFEHGLDVMDIKSSRIIKHYGKGEANNIPNNFILSLYENKANELLAVTSSGIHSYDSKNDDFIAHEAFPEGVFFTSILEDGENRLWAGSYGNGLFSYNPETNLKTIYKHEDDIASSISSNSINGLFQDSEGNIWVCTKEGLNKYRKETDDFIKYAVKQGFPSNVFYAVLEDDKKHLWISTSKGLVDFEPSTEQLNVYTKAHGLLSEQFNYSSAYRSEDGTMYFGSIGGMVSFNPGTAFKKQAYKPPLYMTDLQVNTGEALTYDTDILSGKSIGDMSNVLLKPNQSSFSVEFAALSYTAPEITEYWYNMEGLTDDWIYLENVPKVSFTALGHGEYSLNVKSKNVHGITSEINTPLEIEVLPVFWRSNLAYFLYTAILLFLGYLIFQYFHIKAKARNYRIISEHKNKRDKEVFQAKVEFFTNVSHEIRTPLTLIKNPLEKLLKKPNQNPELRENLDIMQKNTSRLLDLTNQLLDLRQAEIENTSLTFVNTNISELIRKTYTRFSQSILDKAINVTMNLGDKDIYAYVDAEAVRKIVSNLFSNALKYGDKNVSIHLIHNLEFFELCIQNDGHIIPSHLRKKIFEPFYRDNEIRNEAKSGTGLGLALANSLTELHNGRLFLDTANADINSFILRLPIHQKNEINLYEAPNSVSKSGELLNRKSELLLGMKPSILLVDDNPDLLDFIAKELSNDYLVLKAINAIQGLETVKLEPISLVVSDVMMPGMDGFEFCEKLKSEIESSHIPVVLLTVRSALEAKLLGLEHGADAYIEKPFSMDHLKVQVDNLIQNRVKIIEHFSNSPLAHIRSMAHSKTDETFIKKLDSLISEKLSDQDLNVDALAENMHMSRSTFYRKIKELSNLNPNELLNVARLKRAAELLKSDKYKIYEIAEMVGYKSQTSFGRNFQKQFDMTPTEYMKNRS